MPDSGRTGHGLVRAPPSPVQPLIIVTAGSSGKVLPCGRHGPAPEPVLQRLRSYLPDTPPAWWERWQDRFHTIASDACHTDVITALTDPKSTDIITVPLRRGELAALARLLDFADATKRTSSQYGGSDLARTLMRDIHARSDAGGDHNTVDRFQEARHTAERLRAKNT